MGSRIQSRGVRVNPVAPGPVYTRCRQAELMDEAGAATLLHRATRPQEIAEVVAFLASPNASYATGAVIAADGGRLSPPRLTQLQPGLSRLRMTILSSGGTTDRVCDKCEKDGDCIEFVQFDGKLDFKPVDCLCPYQ